MRVITFSPAEMDEMLTKIAADSGMTLEQYKAAVAKDLADHWCQCKPSGDPIFCNDGERINEHCCDKHHYHCSNCLKITQVG
jgi:hypothetical protein